MGAVKLLCVLYYAFFPNFVGTFVSALYFHIGEIETKCLIEDVPEETLVVGNYRVQPLNNLEHLPTNDRHRLFVEVKDPDEKMILSRQCGSEGRFIFMSYTPGEYHICLRSNSSKLSLFAGGMLKVHLNIRSGEAANNYTEISQTERLTNLQLRVRQLGEQVDQILRELNYHRFRGQQFYQTNKSMNERILWWSSVQYLILMAAYIWHLRYTSRDRGKIGSTIATIDGSLFYSTYKDQESSFCTSHLADGKLCAGVPLRGIQKTSSSEKEALLDSDEENDGVHTGRPDIPYL